MTVDIKVLGASDENMLRRVALDVFDNDIDPTLTSEFLRDPRHHLAVAVDGGSVIGFASAVHYVHPDKPPELWINEVGVAPSHQGRGIGKTLLNALFQRARDLECREAWVLTEADNERAVQLYRSVGGQPTAPVMFTFRLD